MAPLIEGRLALPIKNIVPDISQQFMEDDLPPFFWRRFENCTASGICFRVAEFLGDAHKIKEVIHSAWRIKGSEDYFYEVFNDPQVIYQTFIRPAKQTDNILDLNVLSLVAEIEGYGIVGTLSLVFDHLERTVEVGRVAVSFEMRGKGILSQSTETVRTLLALVPDYTLLADTTTLIRSAGDFIRQLGAHGVAFHPSSFAIVPSSIQEWEKRLIDRYGEPVAQTLLFKSEASGLGRFATAYHIGLPSGYKVFTPFTTEQHRPFIDYSRKVLGIKQTHEEQPPFPRKPTFIDRKFTATRTIIDPKKNVEVEDIRQNAFLNGFETVILQLPCDKAYINFHEQITNDRLLLCGVFPNTFGRWYASYILFTTEKHSQQVMANLTFLAEHQGVSSSYQELLGLILN